MSTTPETETPEEIALPDADASPHCLAVGALVVDGKRKAWLRCALPAEHDAPRVVLVGETLPEITMPAGYRLKAGYRFARFMPGTPHAVTLSWADDAAMREDWPEAHDPAEPVDVDVPMLSDDELEAIARDARVDEAVDADREARAFDE